MAKKLRPRNRLRLDDNPNRMLYIDGEEFYPTEYTCNFRSQKHLVPSGTPGPYVTREVYKNLDKRLPENLKDVLWFADSSTTIGRNGKIDGKAYVLNTFISGGLVDGNAYAKDCEVLKSVHVGGKARVIGCEIEGGAELIGTARAEDAHIDSGHYEAGEVDPVVDKALEEVDRLSKADLLEASEVLMNEAEADVLYTRDENGDNPYTARPLPDLSNLKNPKSDESSFDYPQD